MEGVMADYSILVLFFLLLPVLAQIIFPLLMLIIYGFVRAAKSLFCHQEAINHHEKVGQAFQLSRS
jgi:bacteriorhodopsin